MVNIMMVTVGDEKFEIVRDASDTIETLYGDKDTLQVYPILSVTGIGQSLEDGQEYEIVWYLDANDQSELSEDASNWVKDWSTADQANLI